MRMNYFWIRVYDYRKDDALKENADDYIWNRFKGTLLDEYYLCGENMSREMAKQEVIQRSGVEKFAKPRKKDGIYAIILDSTKSYYDRFTEKIDTLCFNCYTPIKGKLKDFPVMMGENGKRYCFCSYDCKRKMQKK